MKARVLALVCAGVLSSVCGCSDWKPNAEIHGVRFTKAKIDERGFVVGLLGADTVIAGRPCKAGWVHLHPNGTPAGFTATAGISLDHFEIPAGTWVFQTEEGVITVCSFPRDIEVQGHLCRGGGLIGGSEGVQASFYPSGALKEFFAPHPIRIDGVPCGASAFEPGIELYESGRLQSATLSDDLVQDGRLYRRGKRIHLTPEGRIDTIR